MNDMISPNDINIAQDELFKTIELLCKQYMKDMNKADETIECKIIDASDAKNHKYTVITSNNIKLIVQSENTDYKVADKVQVLIPQGDYTAIKRIIGKCYDENSENVALDALNLIPIKTFQETAGGGVTWYYEIDAGQIQFSYFKLRFKFNSDNWSNGIENSEITIKLTTITGDEIVFAYPFSSLFGNPTTQSGLENILYEIKDFFTPIAIKQLTWSCDMAGQGIFLELGRAQKEPLALVSRTLPPFYSTPYNVNKIQDADFIAAKNALDNNIIENLSQYLSGQPYYGGKTHIPLGSHRGKFGEDMFLYNAITDKTLVQRVSGKDQQTSYIKTTVEPISAIVPFKGYGGMKLDNINPLYGIIFSTHEIEGDGCFSCYLEYPWQTKLFDKDTYPIFIGTGEQDIDTLTQLTVDEIHNNQIILPTVSLGSAISCLGIFCLLPTAFHIVINSLILTTETGNEWTVSLKEDYAYFSSITAIEKYAEGLASIQFMMRLHDAVLTSDSSQQFNDLICICHSRVKYDKTTELWKWETDKSLIIDKIYSRRINKSNNIEYFNWSNTSSININTVFSQLTTAINFCIAHPDCLPFSKIQSGDQLNYSNFSYKNLNLTLANPTLFKTNDIKELELVHEDLYWSDDNHLLPITGTISISGKANYKQEPPQYWVEWYRLSGNNNEIPLLQKNQEYPFTFIPEYSGYDKEKIIFAKMYKNGEAFQSNQFIL